MTNPLESTTPSGGDPAVDAYDRITDPIFALDREWRFTFLNEQAEQVLQRDEEHALGTAVWEVFPDGDDAAFRSEFERAVRTQQGVTFEAYYDPLDIWFEVRAYPSDTGLSVSLHDVTDRVGRDETLQDREQTLREVYEIIADPDRSFDDRVTALLHVVRTTIGTEYATLSRIDQDADEYVFEAVAAPEGADLEAGDVTSLSATNCEHAVSTEQTLVLEDVEADAPELADRAGNAEWGISCYLGTPVSVGEEVYGTFCFYDTEARSGDFSDWEVTLVELLGNWVSTELERQRRQRELETSNERLEQFAYVASHDLQEPLRMVSSYLQLIERRYVDDLDEDGREFLDYAVDGADRMRAMIEGLLEYSRVETQGDPFEPVDLDDVLADILDDLKLQIAKSDAAVEAESLPTVEGDADQLRQVFQNLLSNAINYSGDDPPEIEVSAERRGSEWVLSVRDHGIGIDAGDFDRIFDVFDRLHTHEEQPGTGIGLALCRKIIDRHGGEIWVDSDPGEGSTFSFSLPAVDPA